MKEFTLQKYQETIDFIKARHADQIRSFTICPYWVHPIRVAVLAAKYKQSHKIDEIIIAALLHDTVEDTKTTLEEIEKEYGELVRSLVEELTSDKKEQNFIGKTEYLSQKLYKMSSWGLVIKLCDRLDNVSDFGFAPQKFIDKYAKETLAVLSYIEAKREYLSDTHNKIMADIRAMVALYYQETNNI